MKDEKKAGPPCPPEYLPVGKAEMEGSGVKELGLTGRIDRVFDGDRIVSDVAGWGMEGKITFQRNGQEVDVAGVELPGYGGPLPGVEKSLPGRCQVDVGARAVHQLDLIRKTGRAKGGKVDRLSAGVGDNERQGDTLSLAKVRLGQPGVQSGMEAWNGRLSLGRATLEQQRTKNGSDKRHGGAKDHGALVGLDGRVLVAI